ncbi:MAG: phage tail protein [Mariniphaga sp.]|nr:phage tail protein [Mariniphaga sp.]
MTYKYPPVGFHFKVVFTGFSSEADTLFQSVSGLSVDVETEEIAEGGENRFKHKLPGRIKYPNLVLKRGMITSSELITWVRNAFENNEYSPVDLTISLLNENHEALAVWNVEHAYPVKWSASDFNAEESKIVIETIELTYNYFNRV